MLAFFIKWLSAGKQQFQILQGNYKLQTEDSKNLLLYVLLSSLFVLPIINANIYHQDDLYRIYNSIFWENLGRPLATETTRLISGSANRILDSAPFTQILSALLLGYSAFILAKFLNTKFYFSGRLVYILPFLSPLFLHNLSYRYDSFGMSLGILFATLAFCQNTKNIFGICFAILLMACGLSLYQVDLNIYIALVALEVVLAVTIYSYRQLLLLLAQRCIVFIAGYALYYSGYALYYFMVTFNSSGSVKRSSIIPFNENFFTILYDNIFSFIALFLSFFSYPQSKYLILILCLVPFVIHTINLFKPKISPLKIILFFPIAIVVFIVSLMGPMAILENTLATYRTMPSFYVFSCLLVLMSSVLYKRLDYLAIFPIFFALSFSFQYGNAYKNQRDYEKGIIQQVTYDVEHFVKSDKTIYTFGGIGMAPQARLIMESNPIIRNMIRPASKWVLEGLMIRQGLIKTKFLWDSARHKKEILMITDLCGDGLLKTSTTKYELFESPENIYVLFNKSFDSICSNSI